MIFFTMKCASHVKTSSFDQGIQNVRITSCDENNVHYATCTLHLYVYAYVHINKNICKNIKMHPTVWLHKYVYDVYSMALHALHFLDKYLQRIYAKEDLKIKTFYINVHNISNWWKWWHLNMYSCRFKVTGARDYNYLKMI